MKASFGCQEKFRNGAQIRHMATHLQPAPHKPLLDPHQFEEAGRAFRIWLDRLLHTPEPEHDTSIAWEDGEPHQDRPDKAPPGH